MINEESVRLHQPTPRPVLRGHFEICIFSMSNLRKDVCVSYLHSYLEPFEVMDYGNSLKCLIKISRNKREREIL